MVSVFRELKKVCPCRAVKLSSVTENAAKGSGDDVARNGRRMGL